MSEYVRGEYKAPGAKLVVLEAWVSDGVIADARLSGDFFLEPDEVLEILNAALVGVSVSDRDDEIVARLNTELPRDVSMVGITPEAVVAAFRRAIPTSSRWLDYDWRLIHEKPQSPLTHMALDEVLARQVADGRRQPTLRIWEWAAPTVVLGSFQSVRNEVDVDSARRHGIDVVRRISGGGAMFIEPGNTITYSLYAPPELVSGMSFIDSYAFLDDWVLGALRDVGITAWYEPINDITSAEGKVAGAAQKRLADGTVLHHVTMAYDIDADKMLDVLRIGREKLAKKGTRSANKRVDPLRRQTGLAREVIVDTLIDHFAGRYGLRPDRPSESEHDRAERLVSDKFATEDWLHRVP
ncbi:lipoate--protein ligase family protein [Haloglycomyces albus]|uniref:lipoate--protein ligase family protein n=1 Tax=Haloglycomyces albus TaxID=526067 RepID=UPI0004A48E29|nr:biotin/lipoate A/B protein ligase family protein [Haloglycomyces albus]